MFEGGSLRRRSRERESGSSGAIRGDNFVMRCAAADVLWYMCCGRWGVGRVFEVIYTIGTGFVCRRRGVEASLCRCRCSSSPRCLAPARCPPATCVCASESSRVSISPSGGAQTHRSPSPASCLARPIEFPMFHCFRPVLAHCHTSPFATRLPTPLCNLKSPKHGEQTIRIRQLASLLPVQRTQFTNPAPPPHTQFSPTHYVPTSRACEHPLPLQ